jgi:hypothetical protein
MRIKAGKFTLAITMIASGILMLSNTMSGNPILRNVWLYSPVVLVLFGLEIIILNLIYMHKENYKVEVSGGSIVLIIIIIALLIMNYNQFGIHDPNWRHFNEIFKT